jgi:hypothetical protein
MRSELTGFLGVRRNYHIKYAWLFTEASEFSKGVSD